MGSASWKAFEAAGDNRLAVDRANTQWLRASELALDGNRAGALDTWDRAIGAMEKVVKQHPADPRVRDEFLVLLHATVLALGNRADPASELRLSETVMRSLEEATSADDGRQAAGDLALILAIRGRALVASGDSVKALECYRKALAGSTALLARSARNPLAGFVLASVLLDFSTTFRSEPVGDALNQYRKYLDAARDDSAADPVNVSGQVIARLEPQRRSRQQQEELGDFFVGNGLSKMGLEKKHVDEIRKRFKELQATAPQISRAQTVSENEFPPRTRLMIGGEYGQWGREVKPGVPAFLPPLTAGAEPPRLALARWLVSRENPLTARVEVNRIWQELFGRGLVRTSEDFGIQGDDPSHPELLDWLAVEFVDRGWSLKEMIRLIVTSATYRQSSHTRPELAERDPENVLLARQSRMQLPAELIRDSALYAAGLLNPAVGGKSVRPAAACRSGRTRLLELGEMGRESRCRPVSPRALHFLPTSGALSTVD